jgi:hypothetical protein
MPFALSLFIVATECVAASEQGATNINAPNHQPCYGRLFPETFHGGSKGKVFSLQSVTPAGMMPRRSQPVVDLEAWDECSTCPALENCYKLSMAKLAFAQASGTM